MTRRTGFLKPRAGRETREERRERLHNEMWAAKEEEAGDDPAAQLAVATDRLRAMLRKVPPSRRRAAYGEAITEITELRHEIVRSFAPEIERH